MHIPVRLGFVGANGALPLTLEGENATGPERARARTDRSASRRFTFVDVAEAPLLSHRPRLLRAGAFQSRRSTANRAPTLMGRDADAFNRWEAGQALATEMLLEMAANASPAQRRTPIRPMSRPSARCWRAPTTTIAFAAQMLVPPLESELALQ